MLYGDLFEMSERQRARIPRRDFVFPDRRAWPIPDAKHAKIALQYIKMRRGRPEDWPVVRKAVCDRFPRVCKRLHEGRSGRRARFSLEESGREVRDLHGNVFGPRRGLEGPFLYRTGIVLYYDAREGRYYDPLRDEYLPKDARVFHRMTGM